MATASLHIPDPGKTLRDIKHAVEGGLNDVRHAAATAPAAARPPVDLAPRAAVSGVHGGGDEVLAPANQELGTHRGSGCVRAPGEIRGPAGCTGGRQPLRAPVRRQARRSNGPKRRRLPRNPLPGDRIMNSTSETGPGRYFGNVPWAQMYSWPS